MAATYHVTVPPPHYDHRYHGPVIERVVPRTDNLLKCGADACSWVVKGVCHIQLPQGEPAIALLRRHEMGHCNGWGGDHAGGRSVEMNESGQISRPSNHPTVTFW
jgi:hypothetical protein